MHWCPSYLLLRPPAAFRRTAAGLSLYRAPRLWGRHTVRETWHYSPSLSNTWKHNHEDTDGSKNMSSVSGENTGNNLNRENWDQHKPHYVSHKQHESIFGWHAEVFPIDSNLSRKQNQGTNQVTLYKTVMMTYMMIYSKLNCSPCDRTVYDLRRELQKFGWSLLNSNMGNNMLCSPWCTRSCWGTWWTSPDTRSSTSGNTSESEHMDSEPLKTRSQNTHSLSNL